MEIAKMLEQQENTEGPGGLGISVRSYTPIGSLQGLGKLTIDAREHMNLDSQSLDYFLVLTVTDSGEYAHTDSAIIPESEVPRIVSAIDYLKNTNPQMTKFKNLEAEFPFGVGGKIVVFSTAKGELNFSVSAGTISAYFSVMNRIEELKTLLVKGMKFIEDNRIRRL